MSGLAIAGWSVALVAGIAWLVTGLRLRGYASDLTLSESQRDTLEAKLAELAEQQDTTLEVKEQRIRAMLEEQEALRAEIRRRRRPGDARRGLRVLSEAGGEAADRHH